MRWYFAIALVGLLAPTAAAQDIRVATEAEIAMALVGCWHREPTVESQRDEGRGLVSGNTLCFGAENQLEAISWGGTKKWGFDGVGSDGTYQVAEGKLHLAGEGDGWCFGSDRVTCDVVVRPAFAVQFRNCTGGDGVVLPNTSYSRADQ